MLSRIAAAAATAFALTAGGALAATYDFDAAGSTIDLDGVDGCVGAFFTPANCHLEADFTSDAEDWSWSTWTVGSSDTINDFIDWTAVLSGWLPTGGGIYDVTVNLLFSSPSASSGSASGGSFFVTVAGLLTSGGVTWDNGGQGTVKFEDGTTLAFDLEEGFAFGHSSSATSGVTFTLAAVPVPAAGFLLVGALGGLAALRRRRKAA